MRAVLTRGFRDHRATLGMLQVEGIQHDPIFTLENPFRSPGYDTLITAGTYQCKPHSGPKFQDVWEICNVPYKTDILIHWGTTETDSLGCVIAGLGSGMYLGKPAVFHSRDAILLMRKLIGVREWEIEVVEISSPADPR